LAPADGRGIRRTGRTPRIATADRGYGEKRVDDALQELGVRTVVIPRKGRPSKARQAVEHRRAFRRTVKWRTGCEGRISTLKRSYGWDRIDGIDGARIWTGHGVPAHNLVKLSAQTA
jgi:IS5 family transposase